MSDKILKEFLKEKTRSKETFSLRALKKAYPEDKDEIKTLKFVGLIDVVNIEFPDEVRAYIYN